MKFVFLILSLITTLFCNAQTSFQVTPRPDKPLDIYIAPFGIANAIKVGALDTDGNAVFNGSIDFEKAPESVRTSSKLKMDEVLVYCDQMTPELSESQNIDAYEIECYFLFSGVNPDLNKPAGIISLVSDTSLFSWVMNPNKYNPVLGSTYELIYVSENFDYNSSCNEAYALDSGDAEAVYQIDLHLKPGLNYIESKIESIRSDSDRSTSFPDKVRITSHQKLPHSVIGAAYYY